jgi:GR25 family glycosyltransferase involved in LPS biosynthesis
MGIAINNLFYVPLGGSTKVLKESIDSRNTGSKQESGTVLIYGDFKGSSRRKDFLKLAREKISNLKVFEEKFGNSMQEELLSSKVVLNVNYYSPGILATPRLWESLSAGNSVVSEKSLNWSEYPEICKLVEFVEEGQFDELIDRAQELLGAGTFDFEIKRELIQSSENRFRFMLARGLFGSGFADDDFYLSNMDIPPKRDDVKIVLSMPETTERRNRAVKSLPAEMIFFDGVKQVPGWIGCAKSYKFLSRALLNQGVSRVVICEDDVVLPPSYESDIKVIYDYLDSIGDDWDVFVGLSADFDYKTTIFDVQEFSGKRFIHCNKFTSMVFNIYSRRGLEKLSSWTTEDWNYDPNKTIDRFLNQESSLRVVSLDRDIFGHESELSSTLWDHSNSEYDSMIMRSKYIRYGLMQEWIDASEK